MSRHRIHALIAAVLITAGFSFADSKSSQAGKTEPMTKETRMLVIRSLNAELAFVRKPFPMGLKGITVKDGVISPGDQELQLLVAQYGLAAKPGDRARISDVVIKSDRIRLEINGGPKKKQKWYQHIEIGGMGGMTPVAPDKNDPNAKGSYIELVFDKYVPEMTGDQIRDMLAPVLDFHAKSAVEAYLDTVPPKVKDAIKNHHVLVGMNREMVTYAMGRPQQRLREKDDSGAEYEEWIYGEPPHQVDFIRFVGDEVVQLKQMKVDGTKLVRTEKEVDVTPVSVTVAKKDDQKGKPAGGPSLRRPGEKPELDAPSKLPTGGAPVPPPDTQPGPPQGQGQPPGLPPS